MTINPLCSAPFNSIMVDSNKKIKPCCNWDDTFIGDLNVSTTEEIFNSNRVIDIRDKLLKQEWPKGCMRCKQREEEVGTSVRTNVYNTVKADLSNKIKYLEYNSTNTCNLACAMCSPSWSSSWVQFRQKHDWWMDYDAENIWPEWKHHPINMVVANQFIEKTNLSELETLWFKGGEPFLNKENVLLLEHLKDIGRLDQVEITLTTNGTVINEKMLALLEQAKSVRFIVSCDGVGEINNYIRFSVADYNESNNSNIKDNVIKMSQLGNLEGIGPTIAIQAYNIFNLHDFFKWWQTDIKTLDPNKIWNAGMDHMVLHPEYLSARVLTDDTRLQMADFYNNIDSNLYKSLINYLRLPWLGKERHEEFKRFTRELDLTRPKKLIDIEPEFINELK